MTFAPLPRALLDETLPTCFLRRARERPGSLAVAADDASYTYEALARRSAQIAGIVDGRAPRDTPLPLLVEQGAELVAALVGILRSGRAYAPLDGTLRDTDLRKILRELEASCVVTDAANVERVIHLGAQPVTLEEAAGDGEWSEPRLAPDDLAYVYFTSGTTGAPKGVMDTHRNVIHNVMRYVNALEISPHDRLTLLQAPAFSGAVSNIFSALVAGACVYPYDVAKAGVGSIAGWLERNEITIYHSVPSLFRHALADASALPALRLIRLEGDRASPRDLELFHRRFDGNCTLVNGLGATECGIVRRLFVTNGDRSWSAQPTVPIGYAVDEIEVVVQDESGEPVAAGEIGEIVVKSRFLSPGYWRRPDLTAERFRDEPEPGLRAYRTGDLGRMTADGCLEHLGRTDFQVKVQGKWVETDAVEHLLRTSGLVEDAAVTARERESGETVLVGLVVPANGEAPDTADLRAAILDRIPAHAVPHEWVVLGELPLTSNGKLDRHALGERAATVPARRWTIAETLTATEELVASIWCDVLEREHVDVDTHFDELGGDSLSATAVCSRLEKLGGKQVPENVFLRAPTVRRFAAELDRGVDQRSEGALFNRAGDATPLVLLHGDYEGQGLYAARIAHALGPDHPTLVFGPHRPSRTGEPGTIEEMAVAFASRVESTFDRLQPIVVAGYAHAGGLVALELGLELARRGFSVAGTVLIATVAPHPATRLLRAPVALVSRALRLSPATEARAVARLARPMKRVGRRLSAQRGWHPTDGPRSDAAWRAAAAGYTARAKAAGAVTLVWCAGDPTPDVSDPAARWRRLDPELMTVVLDSTFERVVLDHSDALAEVLRGALTAGPSRRGEMQQDRRRPLLA